MIRVCSYCKLVMGVKEPIKDTSFTHGICPRCAWEQSTLPKEEEVMQKTYLGHGLKFSSVIFYPDTHQHRPTLSLGDAFFGQSVVGIERVERPNLGVGTAYYLQEPEDVTVQGTLD